MELGRFHVIYAAVISHDVQIYFPDRWLSVHQQLESLIKNQKSKYLTVAWYRLYFYQQATVAGCLTLVLSIRSEVPWTCRPSLAPAFSDLFSVFTGISTGNNWQEVSTTPQKLGDIQQQSME